MSSTAAIATAAALAAAAANSCVFVVWRSLMMMMVLLTVVFVFVLFYFICFVLFCLFVSVLNEREGGSLARLLVPAWNDSPRMRAAPPMVINLNDVVFVLFVVLFSDGLLCMVKVDDGIGRTSRRAAALRPKVRN